LVRLYDGCVEGHEADTKQVQVGEPPSVAIVHMHIKWVLPG
jgi:hypothetical protein